MTFPSPQPAAQIPIASGINQNSSARTVRAQQSVWGLPPPASSARRGLTPLSTDLSSSSLETSGPPTISTTSASPFPSTFSSILNSSSRNNNNRGSYTASTSASLFSPIQTGSQQSNSSQLLSPRSRTITPSSISHLASFAAASATASQAGGGGSSGSGGSSRNQAFSPSLPQQVLNSPTSSTFDRSAFTGLPSASTSSSQPSVSKIVVTQVFLLLGSITEKEGKAKWESQAETIHKVCFLPLTKYFARALKRAYEKL